MRLFRTYQILLIILMATLAFESIGHAQNTEVFDKALKKAAKSPEKNKNKEALDQAYVDLQTIYIQKLIPDLSESNLLGKDVKKVLTEYLNTRKAYTTIYDQTPKIDNEGQLDVLLEQLTHDYYERGLKLIGKNSTEEFAKAKEYLELVKDINPNYQNVTELYNQAVENAKYNILITYDLGNFPEYQPLMQQLLNDLNLKIENYNTEKKTFHLTEKPDQDYHLIYKFSFNYIDLGLTTRKSNTQEFQRTVDGQIKRAKVNFENFIRNSKANGAFSIFSKVKSEEIEKDPFNLNFTTNVQNATISGDQDA
ncbi:MAG TPA: hypothetical protein VIN11_02985, partial [Roseivirga sp.]